jgi:hypothetical protein
VRTVSAPPRKYFVFDETVDEGFSSAADNDNQRKIKTKIKSARAPLERGT